MTGIIKQFRGQNAYNQMVIAKAKYFSQRNDSLTPSINCYVNSIASLLSAHPRTDNAEIENFTGYKQDLSEAILISVTKFLSEFTISDLQAIGITEQIKNLRFYHQFWPIWCEKTFETIRIKYVAWDLSEIEAYITKTHLPVVCSTQLTVKGHIVCVLGADKSAQRVICHDPWGKYPYRETNGSHVDYILPKIFDKQHNCQIIELP